MKFLDKDIERIEREHENLIQAYGCVPALRAAIENHTEKNQFSNVLEDSRTLFSHPLCVLWRACYNISWNINDRVGFFHSQVATQQI